MARPLYILCAESGAEDKRTGLFSHFKVIEQVEVRALPNASEGKTVIVPRMQFQAVAVWAKEERDDPKQEYEYRFLFYLPPNEEEVVVKSGTFRFDSLLFYRFIITSLGDVFQGAGTFRAECRIRPTQSKDDTWMSQSYSFAVVERDPESVEQTR
jgi:hypothetical protein